MLCRATQQVSASDRVASAANEGQRRQGRQSPQAGPPGTVRAPNERGRKWSRLFPYLLCSRGGLDVRLFFLGVRAFPANYLVGEGMAAEHVQNARWPGAVLDSGCAGLMSKLWSLAGRLGACFFMRSMADASV